MGVAEEDDPDRERLEAAALWYAELEDNVANLDAFERWRAVPENALAFLKVAGSADWLEAQKHMLAGERLATVKPQPTVTHRRGLLFGGAAAGLALAAVGAFALFNPPRAMASTDTGQRSSLSLPDGGQVDLNTESKAYWRFDSHIRHVWLDHGEIALSIATDARPFVLSVNKQDVVLAQGFYNIRFTGPDVHVAVFDGEARARSRSGPDARGNLPAVVVKRGTAAEFGASQPQIRALTPADVDAITAWRGDEIVFRGVSLARAVEDYNRYLRRKIVIASPGLDRLQIGGRFTTRNPSDFLSALRTSFQIQATDSGQGVIELRK